MNNTDNKISKKLKNFYNYLIEEYNEKVEFGIQEEWDLLYSVINKFEKLGLNKI